jgi:hypothetical protein
LGVCKPGTTTGQITGRTGKVTGRTGRTSGISGSCPFTYQTCLTDQDCASVASGLVCGGYSQCQSSSCSLDAQCNPVICTLDCGFGPNGQQLGYCQRSAVKSITGIARNTGVVASSGIRDTGPWWNPGFNPGSATSLGSRGRRRRVRTGIVRRR